MSNLIFQNVIVHDECWEWQGVQRKGYGRISVDSKQYSVHRVVFADIHGPIPEGMTVLHTCDNPPCCRPEHLRLATQAENMADMLAKGRHVPGTGGTPPHAFGVGHANAKMTDEIVLAIRARYAEGAITQKELATEFAVHQSQVSRAISGKGWGHLL
jgi:hypothetical protein